MKFEKLYYLARRKKGEYEHDECSITAITEDGDNIEQCLDAVKTSVYSWISGQVENIAPKKEQVEAPVASEEPKEYEKKATRSTSTKTKKEEPKAEEPKKESPSEEPSEVTIDMVREALQSVWKAKGKAIATEVLTKFEANKVTDIKPEDYAAVLKECNVALKS